MRPTSSLMASASIRKTLLADSEIIEAISEIPSGEGKDGFWLLRWSSCRWRPTPTPLQRRGLIFVFCSYSNGPSSSRKEVTCIRRDDPQDHEYLCRKCGSLSRLSRRAISSIVPDSLVDSFRLRIAS